MNCYGLPGQTAPSISDCCFGKQLAGSLLEGQQQDGFLVLSGLFPLSVTVPVPWAVCSPALSGSVVRSHPVLSALLCAVSCSLPPLSSAGSSMPSGSPDPLLPPGFLVCSRLFKASPLAPDCHSCCLRLPGALHSLPSTSLGRF